MADTLYTAVATATGDGRAGGRAVSDDGQLDVTLAVPRQMGGPGGGTNPEQLFAAGWSSCFHSALKMVAAQRKVPVGPTRPSSPRSTSTRPATAASRSARRCTSSSGAASPRTSRGNIPVTVRTTVA